MQNYNLVFYDFEIKKDWWCCTFLENEEYITITDRTTLIDYILRKKDNSVFIGYNNHHFDNYCLKAIWYNVNPYKIVDWVIKEGNKPWLLPDLQYKKNVNIYSFDLMRALGVMAPPLKEIEGNLGLDIIFDKTITEEKEEGLTKEEIEKIISYNKHDVYTTKRLFDIIRYEFDAMMLLIEHYALPMSTLSKTKASILETIYKSNLKNPVKIKEFKYKAPSFIKLYDDQVKKAMESFEFTEDNDFEATFEFNGEKFVIKRGGAHYALKNLYKKLSEHCILVTADFGSFYPNMAANKTNPELRYIDESLDWTLFRGMIDLRMEEKKKKTPLSEALKIPLNGAYGKLIDKFSKLYNWQAGLSICLTGQLITIMICQELENKKIGTLANVNTDGFYYLINSKDKLNEFEKIMKDFELKTGITFSYDVIDSGVFAQKDVNNYIIYDKKNNKIKTKGGMVNRYNTDRIWYQYSQAIVDEAVVNKLAFNKPIRDTIMEAYEKNEAIKFQIISNMRGKNWEGCYLCWSKDEEEFINQTMSKSQLTKKIREVTKTEPTEKITRCFAVADKSKPRLGKLKEATYHKFANTPNHIYMHNQDIKDFDVRKIGLDIEWYCKLAQKRVEAFLGK